MRVVNRSLFMPSRFVDALGLGLVLLVLAGCGTPRVLHGSKPQMKNADSFLPRVAVMPFENRSNFSGQWALGSGFADLLTTYLLRTNKMVVLERNDIEDVLSELQLQNSGLVRSEGRANEQRIKNVEVLVRGVITEFVVTQGGEGWFGANKIFLRGKGQRARVSMNLKVYDVETGEVIASVETAGTASSGAFGGAANYEQMTFGGEAFYKTPLGKATRQAMERAIHKIVQVLPQKEWKARVAYREGIGVIINGGSNVGVQLGDKFAVRGAPQAITDPVSGEVLREMAGQIVGQLVVEQVESQSAAARLIYGEAERGSVLERIDPRDLDPENAREERDPGGSAEPPAVRRRSFQRRPAVEGL